MAKVAIIGSGFIGRAWAISFARAGHEVALADRSPTAPTAAIQYIKTVLPDLERNDLLRGASAASVVERLSPAAGYVEALSGAAYVQENTPEALDVKLAVFAELDDLAGPDCLLASSTSGIVPSAFTRHLAGRSRCMVAHPINPPYLVPAVEVVPAPWTAREAVDRAASFLRAVGQSPIVMKREIDGFIMNRMQAALLDEAIRLVADGHATVEDVDAGIREGLAPRWSFMGPLETIDLNAPGGVRDFVERYGPLFRRILDSTHGVDWSGPALDEIETQRRQRVSADHLAERQAWRDRRLMALAVHRNRAKDEIGE